MAIICFNILTQQKNFGSSKFEVLFEFVNGAPNHSFWVIPPQTIFLEGALPSLSSSEVPAVPPARHSSARAGHRARNGNGKRGPSAHCHEAVLCIWYSTTVLDPAGPEGFALGQYTKPKSLDWVEKLQNKVFSFISSAFPSLHAQPHHSWYFST